MSLAKYLAKLKTSAEPLLEKALVIGKGAAHSDIGKDALLGAAMGAPLEMATRDEDEESLGKSALKGGVKGGALSAGTMSVLRRLGL